MTMALRHLREETGSILLLGVGVASAWVATTALGPRTPIDDGLVLIAGVLGVCAWLCRESGGGGVIATSIPLVLGISVSTPDERVRLLGYGIVLAATVFAAVALLLRNGRLDPARATVIAAACAAVLKLLPLSDLTISNLIVVAGVALFAASLFSKRESVPPVLLAVVLLVAAATPIHPVRASLFPLVLAALVWWLRSPSHLGAILALGAGFAAGKWAFLLVAVPLVSETIVSRSNRREGVVSTLSTIPFRFQKAGLAVALRSILVVPGAVPALARASSSTMVAALVMIGIGVTLRPWLATAWMLGAIVVILSRAALGGRDPFGQVTVVITLAVLILFSWSGVIVSFFPLPVSTPAVVAVVLIASFPAVIPLPRIGGVVVASAFFVLAGGLGTFTTEGWTDGERVEARVGAGESVAIAAPAGHRAVDLLLTGINLVDASAGVEIASVEILGRDGRAWRRPVWIGDVADWGAFRPGTGFATWNPVPRRHTGIPEGYAASSWIRGGGFVRVAIEGEIAIVVVAGSGELGQTGGVVVERVRFER